MIGSMILLTIQGKSSRQIQLDQVTAEALYGAIKEELEKKEGEFIRPLDRSDYRERQERIENNFKRALQEGIKGEGTIEYQFVTNDWRKGLFSVKVTRKFLHPNGNEGEVATTRTIILDYM